MLPPISTPGPVSNVMISCGLFPFFGQRVDRILLRVCAPNSDKCLTLFPFVPTRRLLHPQPYSFLSISSRETRACSRSQSGQSFLLPIRPGPSSRLMNPEWDWCRFAFFFLFHLVCAVSLKADYRRPFPPLHLLAGFATLTFVSRPLGSHRPRPFFDSA